jgi:hypothetical protein
MRRLVVAKGAAVDLLPLEAQISGGGGGGGGGGGSGGRGGGGHGVKPPRLRFDRVVLGLLARLRTALQDGAPSGRVAMVTVTAPIRLASKTGAEIEERARRLLRRSSANGRFAGRIHGNAVQIRIMRGGKGQATALAGFVHNRDSEPEILFDLAKALLSRAPAAKTGRRRSSRERWLVIALEDAPSWTSTYGHLCEQLFALAGYRRVLVVGADGEMAAA